MELSSHWHTTPSFFCAFVLISTLISITCSSAYVLRFNSKSGQFKILQVADMHYANGASTRCLDVPNSAFPYCSDLNTTAFLNRMIAAEKPDLVVFTGDNIFGADCYNAAKSQVAAFAPVVNAKIPWAAVLGNHDEEGNLTRKELMAQIASMDYSLAQINPMPDNTAAMCSNSDNYVDIDGYGNYNIEVKGTAGSPLANASVLNLFFLDSGDYSKVAQSDSIYDWIKSSQQVWFNRASKNLQAQYKSQHTTYKHNDIAPTLVYFHIPIPEFMSFNESTRIGVKQDPISSATVNSGFFTTMLETGGVKAAFVGHDHLNDFCGKLNDINLCYAGGFGYHAYGLPTWSRRARVVVASLSKNSNGKSSQWGDVSSITTWKRLDNHALTIVDKEVLWSS